MLKKFINFVTIVTIITQKMDNKFNPAIHHRHSIRLKGYDYSKAGLYFITICCQNRACLFGHIIDGEMVLNDAGTMIEKWYYELATKFPEMKCDEMIIMPNHFHCIVNNVGADPRVCPDNNAPSIQLGEPIILGEPIQLGEHVGSPQRVGSSNIDGSSQRVGSPIPRVVQWFKTMTTNEYIRGVKSFGWAPFDGKLWQRNYYEHIIRDEKSYHNIKQYIVNNPINWKNDKLR